jgi:hypothetical protein
LRISGEAFTLDSKLNIAIGDRVYSSSLAIRAFYPRLFRAPRTFAAGSS